MQLVIIGQVRAHLPSCHNQAEPDELLGYFDPAKTFKHMGISSMGPLGGLARFRQLTAVPA